MLKKFTSISVGLLLCTSSVAFAQTTDDTPTTTSNSGTYCPHLTTTFQRGARDATTSGQVSELQSFLTDYYNLPDGQIIGGFFGALTQKYVVQFQAEQGLPAFGIIGTLTRDRIAAMCSDTKLTKSADTTQPSISPGSSAHNSTSYSSRDIELARQNGQALICTSTLKTPSNKTVWYVGDHALASFSQATFGTSTISTHILIRDGVQYVWFTDKEIGTKSPFNGFNLLQSTEKILLCEIKNPDLSLLQVPGTIKFLDFSSSREGSSMRDRDARRTGDIKLLQFVLEKYYDANGYYPVAINTQNVVTPGYISVIPNDPSTHVAYQYAALGDGNHCTGYHLGATLESATSSYLANDSDAASSSACTGSGVDFSGADPVYDVTSPPAVTSPSHAPGYDGNTYSKLQIQEVTAGSGVVAGAGDKISVIYVAKLQNGKVFDSSAAHGGSPLEFVLGQPGLIAGFQQGIVGMKEGGERLILVPSSLGYGSQEVKDASGNTLIPADSTLIFDIKLVKGGSQTKLLIPASLPVSGSASNSSSPSIHLIAPDGSASYPAGSGRSFMIAWYFSVTPAAGSTICTTLVSQTTGKIFAFPADKGCIDAATVPSARTGTLVRTSGYDLGPDTYKVKIQVISPPSGDGKDGGVAAEDISSATITLTSPTTVSLISNTMSAQAAGVASSVMGLITDFLAGRYW